MKDSLPWPDKTPSRGKYEEAGAAASRATVVFSKDRELFVGRPSAEPTLHSIQPLAAANDLEETDDETNSTNIDRRKGPR